MPGRSYRDDDGWIRPYDPSRDVGDWSTRPPGNKDNGRHNYGFTRDDDDTYRDPYYNRPYSISRHESRQPRRTVSKYSTSSYPSRHIPISRESKTDKKKCIYYALTIFSVIALLLVAALVVFLVLFLLEQQNNNPVIPPITQFPTAQSPSSTQSTQPIVRVDIDATLTQPFLPAYSDATSPEYRELQNNFTNSMDILFAASNLTNSYIGTNVNGFRSGSVIVSATISFNGNVILQIGTGRPMDGQSVELTIGLAVVNAIRTGVGRGSCCPNVEIDSNSVVSTRVTIEGITTSAPTSQPQTTQQLQTTVSITTLVPIMTPVSTTVGEVNPPTTQPPIQPTTQPPIQPSTQAPIPPSTQPPRPIDPPTTPDPVITTSPPAPSTSAPSTPVPSTPVPNPITATTEPPVQGTTLAGVTTAASTGTQRHVDTTISAGTTTGIVPMTTAVEEMTSSLTSKPVTTTAFQTTSETTTVDVPTTQQPLTLNQPGCGLATNHPPSPTDASFLTTSGTWPWVGSLRFRQGHACGVILLNQEWAVTSASCIPSGGALLSLVFGDITSSYSQSIVHVERDIKRIYPHPGFSFVTYDNDVAFIEMVRPVEFTNNVGPVCLQRDEQGGVSSYRNCYVAGWSTLSASPDDNLRTAFVSSVSEGTCTVLLPNLIDKFVCAAFPNADAYVADSASGLMCQNSSTGIWSLVGILDSVGDMTQATFTRVSSYWDAASYIIDGVSGFSCESVQVSQCMSALPYSITHPTTQSSITEVMNMTESSANSCHSLIYSALCAILLPECRANGTGLTLCRQTCRDVTSSCASLFDQLTLEVDCNVYPYGQANSEGLCEAGIEKSCGNISLSIPTLFNPTLISSPNYPLKHATYDDCVWLITGPADSHIVIKFLFLETEACCDTVTIGTGRDVEDWMTIQDRVFGNTLPLPVVVPSADAWLRFQSDYETEFRGFQAEIQAVGNTGLASFCSEPSTYACSDGLNCIPFRWRCDTINDCILRDDESCQTVYQEIILAIDGSERITSPGFGTITGYDNSATYTYVITTAPGRKVLVDFHDFDTESGFDFFTAGNGGDPEDKSTLFYSWSGDLLPPILLSNGRSMWIEFTSDSVTTNRGFDLTVSDVSSSESIVCGSDQFDCGHSVCVPSYWQCDNEADCVDSSDEARCVEVPLSVSGSMVLLSPFMLELENDTSSQFTMLAQQFTTAMDSVLSNNLGSQYFNVSTTVNKFSSADNPILRAVNTPNTSVSFTISLVNRPPASTLNETRQGFMDVLVNEVIDSALVNLPVDPNSVQIYEVLDGTETDQMPTTAPPLCSSSGFECDAGRCIPKTLVCNQDMDCDDGTDEALSIDCAIVCGAQLINISASNMPFSLTVPTLLSDLVGVYSKICTYEIVAPANHSVVMTINANIFATSGVEKMRILAGSELSIEYNKNMVPALDVVSLGETLRIDPMSGMWGENAHGLDLEFRVTVDADIKTCDNGLEVLPTNKICDGEHDCTDYTDEINCLPVCGQSNLTIDYNTSTTLQLTNYPTNYTNNMACRWLITSPHNASIVFQMDVIDIAQLDSLSFGQGHDPNAPLSTVAVFPGILPTGSSIIVTGSQAWVRFLTNHDVTATGFSVSVRVMDDEDFIRCDNLVQVVFQEHICDGIAQCQGDPTDERNCDSCFSIPITNCSNLLPYSTTQYPNPYASDAAVAVTQYERARSHFCNAQTELVVCSLLFRECPVSEPNSRAICRSTCEAALTGCGFNTGICDSLPQTGGELWCNYDNDILETGICGTRPQAPSPFSRIVNGQDASPGEWPWTVAILDADYNFRCGATIINRQWAVTAAHCVSYADFLLMGFIDMTNLGNHFQLIKVAQIITHPFYDDLDLFNQEHDIALLKLTDPLNFNDYIRPACLNTKENEIEIFDNCYAAGWGTLSQGGALPDVLQEVQLPLVMRDNCSQAHQGVFLINDNMLCAGFKDGRSDTCQGDSGGPLVCKESDGRWTLAGITSFGFGCARPNKPGVYVRVSQYIEFIEFYINQDQTTQQLIRT